MKTTCLRRQAPTPPRPRRPRGLLAALLLALGALACGADPTSPGDQTISELPRALTPAETELISASNLFGLELMRQVAAAEGGSNVVVSPLSASMALGMALNGAEGSTFEAMRRTLGYGSLTREEINTSYRELSALLTGLDPSVRFSVANAIWARDDVAFRDAFFDAVTEAFAARVESRDFGDPATLDAINGWVEESTEGYIERLVDEIDPRMVMFLVNAIYFDGSWTTRFDADETAVADFRRADGSTVEVDMMTLTGHAAPVVFTADYAAVELAYGGGAFGMVVVVPQEDTTARGLVEGWTAAWWEDLVARLSEREVDRISLPRFTLSYGTALNDALAAMGMEVALTPGEADFTRLSPAGRDLYIDQVRQQAFIEVDEAGTRAAAATSVGIGVTSLPPRIVADRPFVFAIRERLTGTVLFTGLVGDPTQGS